MGACDRVTHQRTGGQIEARVGRGKEERKEKKEKCEGKPRGIVDGKEQEKEIKLREKNGETLEI